MKARIYSLSEKRWMKAKPLWVRWMKRVKVILYQSPKFNVTIESALLEKKLFKVQFSTGLKDIHGKEIFEGDFIAFNEPFYIDPNSMYEVIFEDAAFMLKPIRLPQGGNMFFARVKSITGFDERGEPVWSEGGGSPRPIADFKNICIIVGNNVEGESVS